MTSIIFFPLRDECDCKQSQSGGGDSREKYRNWPRNSANDGCVWVMLCRWVHVEMTTHITLDHNFISIRLKPADKNVNSDIRRERRSHGHLYHTKRHYAHTHLCIRLTVWSGDTYLGSVECERAEISNHQYRPQCRCRRRRYDYCRMSETQTDLRSSSYFYLKIFIISSRLSFAISTRSNREKKKTRAQRTQKLMLALGIVRESPSIKMILMHTKLHVFGRCFSFRKIRLTNNVKTAKPKKKRKRGREAEKVRWKTEIRKNVKKPWRKRDRETLIKT